MKQIQPNTRLFAMATGTPTSVANFNIDLDELISTPPEVSSELVPTEVQAELNNEKGRENLLLKPSKENQPVVSKETFRNKTPEIGYMVPYKVNVMNWVYGRSISPGIKVVVEKDLSQSGHNSNPQTFTNGIGPTVSMATVTPNKCTSNSWFKRPRMEVSSSTGSNYKRQTKLSSFFTPQNKPSRSPRFIKPSSAPTGVRLPLKSSLIRAPVTMSIQTTSCTNTSKNGRNILHEISSQQHLTRNSTPDKSSQINHDSEIIKTIGSLYVAKIDGQMGIFDPINTLKTYPSWKYDLKINFEITKGVLSESKEYAVDKPSATRLLSHFANYVDHASPHFQRLFRNLEYFVDLRQQTYSCDFHQFED